MRVSSFLAAATLMFVMTACGPASSNTPSITPSRIASAVKKAPELFAVEPALVLDADPKGNWFAVFSPDGKTLAAGGDSGVLQLWNLPSGEPLGASAASKDAFRSAAFAPDGRTLVTGGQSGTLTIWDAQGARSLKSVKKHASSIRTVSFTPDGKQLVASGVDRTLTVWDTRTWTVVRSLPEQPEQILSAAVSPDGKLLAIALGDPNGPASDGGVRLYDFETLEERGELPGLNGSVWSVAFSPDGKTLATGLGWWLGLWDPIARQNRGTVRMPHNIRVLAYAPDGKTLVAAGTTAYTSGGPVGGTAQFLDVATLQPRAVIKKHGRLILGASFSPDGSLLSTASSDPAVRLWDIAKLPPPVPSLVVAPVPSQAIQPLPAAGLPIPGSPPLRFRSALDSLTGDIWFAAFAPDGQTLATGGNDRMLRFWDPQTGDEREAWKTSRAVRAAAFSPDGRWLATACSNGVTQIWDVPQSRVSKTLKKGTAGLRTVAFARDGKTLAVGGEENIAVLYDTATWQEIHSLEPQPEAVLALAYSPDNKILAMATGRTPNRPAASLGSVQFLDPASLEERTALPLTYDVWGLAFSPDGKTLATTSQSPPDPAQLWDLATGTVVRSLHPVWGARRIAFTPDGAIVAVGQVNGNISLFDTATGRLLAASRGHATVIFGLGISPDGKLLATASGGASVKLWDLPVTSSTAGEK